MKQLLIDAMTHPSKLFTKRNLPTRSVINYLLILTLISLILNLIPIGIQFRSFYSDIQEIEKTLGDFEVVDGNLKTNQKEATIHQTPSITIALDPTGKLEEGSSAFYLDQAQVAMIFGQKGLRIKSIASDFDLEYTRFGGPFTKERFFSIISQPTVSIGVMLLAIVPISLLLLFEIILSITLAEIIASLGFALKGIRVDVFEIWKLNMFASTLPIILIAFLNMFNIIFPFQTEIIAISTYYLYFVNFRPLYKIKK